MMSELYILFLVTISLVFAGPNPLDEINIYFNIDDIENKGQAADYGDVIGSGDNDPLEGISINSGAHVGKINNYEVKNKDRKDGQYGGSRSGPDVPAVYNPMYEPEPGSIHGHGHTFGHIGNGGYNQYYDADYGDTRLGDSNGNVDDDSGSGDNDNLEGIVINSGARVDEMHNYEAKNGAIYEPEPHSVHGLGVPRAYSPIYKHNPRKGVIINRGAYVNEMHNYEAKNEDRKNGEHAGKINGRDVSGVYDPMYEPKPGSVINSGARGDEMHNYEAKNGAIYKPEPHSVHGLGVPRAHSPKGQGKRFGYAVNGRYMK